MIEYLYRNSPVDLKVDEPLKDAKPEPLWKSFSPEGQRNFLRCQELLQRQMKINERPPIVRRTDGEKDSDV